MLWQRFMRFIETFMGSCAHLSAKYRPIVSQLSVIVLFKLVDCWSLLLVDLVDIWSVMRVDT